MGRNAKVRVEREGDVAVLVIDNPPINAGSLEVRRGLLEGIREVRPDRAVRAVVILGAGTTFVAGADLREFGRPLEEPQLPAVIAAIEACDKPFVAALHGAALGGGFELALGCDARVASPGTVVGLPEVTLGIIPGAGGTQRLPRIVGIAQALEWICSGERLPLAKALAAGVVDSEISGDLRQGAVRYARAMAGKRRLRDLEAPPSEPAAVEAATVTALNAGRNRPAVKVAIERTMAAATLPIDEALARERAEFQALRVSREACALRHQFFAERDSAKHPSIEGAKPWPVSRIAVVGSGTMGSGIAIAALDAGYDVALIEQDAVDWTAVLQADLVIEAVFEDLAVKQKVFRRLDGLARRGAILASNTSSLDLDAIASAVSRPQDVVGMNFFCPANVMRLVEVVRGKATAADVLATVLAVAKRLKKLPVLAGNTFGFIGNRIHAAYRRQCQIMIEEGAGPRHVDAALEAFGFATGPFAVADLSGPDIARPMRQSQAATRPDRMRAEKGIVRREITADEIRRRSLLAMVNEAALVMAEGVAERATDVDIVLVNGFGFPRWEGGPVFWARERGEESLRADIDWLASVSGPAFVRGDVKWLL